MSDSARLEASPSLQVVVVGGSLVGLGTALALARIGIDVTVLERSRPGAPEGGGLGVDVDLLQQVTGLQTSPPVCWGIDRPTPAWHLLRDWLENAAEESPSIAVHHDTAVMSATSTSDSSEVVSADGRRWSADLVIGADGVHSTIRRFVDPAHPSASYAGFVLWRAMVPEELIIGSAALPDAHEPSRAYYAGPYRLVTYPVPGQDGDDRVGRRRLNLVWYDPAREDLLRSRGLVEGAEVRGSLQASDLPVTVGDELRRIAGETWPSPWAEALRIAFDQHLVFGTPVAEYLPRRLTAGRLAIAGDAAHAASPMVGGGFRHGLFDASAFARSIADTTDVDAALDRYEKSRLGSARDHVTESIRESQLYLERGKSS